MMINVILVEPETEADQNRGVPLNDVMEALRERETHLTKLEQPGPVDLGFEDNEQAQDDLFAELRQVRSIIAYAESIGVEF